VLVREGFVREFAAALKPLIGATGAGASLKEGVLMQALHYFARSENQRWTASSDF
jgi:hypothetical protein